MKCKHEILIYSVTDSYEVGCFCPLCNAYSMWGKSYMNLDNSIERCEITLWSFPYNDQNIIKMINHLYKEAIDKRISYVDYIKSHEDELYQMSIPSCMQKIKR